MEECIYHSDKFVFDNVRKDLQKAKICPRLFGARLAMAVCSCRKHETSLDSEINGDITEQILVLSTELNQPKWDKFPTTQSFLRDMVDCENLNKSQKKLILVIDKALDKNFDALKAEFREKRLEEINIVKKPRFYLNHIGLANIIRKKKNRYPVKREAILPIFGGNSKSLEKETGKGFVTIGKKMDCVVRFESDKTRKFMDEKTSKTVVIVWCQSVESFSEISEHLCLIAERIQSQFTRLHETRQVEMKKKREIRKQTSYKFIDGQIMKGKADDAPDTKEKRSDNFWKKQNKDRKCKKFGQINKEESSPLKGSRCLKCFIEFESLKTGVNDECVYHKGYISYNPAGNLWLWSCCQWSSLEKVNTYENHKATGCHTSRHLWRPHAKASRGDKSERMFMQKMLKLK